MNKKNKSWYIQLFLVGLLLTIANSCEKDEELSKNDPIISWENPADVSNETVLSSLQLNATANVPGKFIYTPGVGTKLYAGANQDLRVDFTPIDVKNYNKGSKTVKINVDSKIKPIISWANPDDIVFGTLLTEKQLNASANIPGTFVYSPEINTKLPLGASQDLRVDFTPTDSDNYSNASKTVKINVVTKLNSVITWANPADIMYGTLLSATQLNATANVPGTFVYTPDFGTELNTYANQDLRVDFTPADTDTYSCASKTVQITVFGTVTDYDGNVYKTITIGTQTWMAENLKSIHYSDGTLIPDVVSYDNTEENAAKYGRLYTWDATMNGSIAEKAQGVSPDGWHIPSDSEWQILENYLGGASIAGGKLKSTTDWKSPNTGATNSSGFSALPAGEYDAHDYIAFRGLGEAAVFWTSTQVTSNGATERWMTFSDDDSTPYNWYKIMKYSIRCIKDETKRSK